MNSASSDRNDTAIPAKKRNGLTILAWAIVILMTTAMGAYIYFQHHILTQRTIEIQALTQARTDLETEKAALGRNVADVTETINLVAEKLRDVRRKQVIIGDLVSQSQTESASQREKVLADIAAIESQLEHDRRDIEELGKRVAQSGIRVKSLESMIASLRKDVDRNVSTIADLRSIIEHKNTILASTEQQLKNTERDLGDTRNVLAETSRVLDDTRSTLEETRNTAYYTVGTRRDLLERNVILEEGSFISKRMTLAGDIHEENFQRVDITRQKELTISGPVKSVKDIRILPPRTESTYAIDTTGSTPVLKVVDPVQFWKIRYLAVVVKG